MLSDQVEWEFWTNSNDMCGAVCDVQKEFIKVRFCFGLVVTTPYMLLVSFCSCHRRRVECKPSSRISPTAGSHGILYLLDQSDPGATAVHDSMPTLVLNVRAVSVASYIWLSLGAWLG